MHRLLLVLLIFVCNHTIAAGFTDKIGINGSGEEITIYFDESRSTGMAYVISVQQGQDGERKEYLLSDECPEHDSENKTIKCNGVGKSRLSGATYQEIENPNKSDCSYTKVLKCIHGCDSSKAPLEIYELPWECYGAVCQEPLSGNAVVRSHYPNWATKVEISDVPVRVNPSEWGIIVGILQPGDSVNIIRNNFVCENINGSWVHGNWNPNSISGRWVNVSFTGSGKQLDGWVFDYFLEKK